MSFCGGLDRDRKKTALQPASVLTCRTILIWRGRSDASHRAVQQRGLEQQRYFVRTSSQQRMQLIKKEDGVGTGPEHFGSHSSKKLFRPRAILSGCMRCWLEVRT